MESIDMKQVNAFGFKTLDRFVERHPEKLREFAITISVIGGHFIENFIPVRAGVNVSLPRIYRIRLTLVRPSL